MHSATFTMCASHFGEGCVLEPSAGPGMNLRHFACAACTAAEDGSIPVPGENWKPPPGLGSGKSGTPLARMQRANFSASGSDCASPAAAPEPALLAVLRVAVLVMLATEGDFDPPQPPRAMPTPTAARSARPFSMSTLYGTAGDSAVTTSVTWLSPSTRHALATV